MTKKEIAIMELLKEKKKATFKDIVKYKLIWIIKVIYVLYLKYVELYDFEDLF